MTVTIKQAADAYDARKHAMMGDDAVGAIRPPEDGALVTSGLDFDFDEAIDVAHEAGEAHATLLHLFARNGTLLGPDFLAESAWMDGFATAMMFVKLRADEARKSAPGSVPE